MSVAVRTRAWLPPLLSTEKWLQLIRLDRLFAIALAVLFYQCFDPLLFEPLAGGFTKQLSALLVSGLGKGIDLFEQVLVHSNRDRFHIHEKMERDVRLRCANLT